MPRPSAAPRAPTPDLSGLSLAPASRGPAAPGSSTHAGSSSSARSASSCPSPSSSPPRSALTSASPPRSASTSASPPHSASTSASPPRSASTSASPPPPPRSAAHAALLELAASVQAFLDDHERHLYAAPVIDWHAPRAHRQGAVGGLSRFVAMVDKELGAVQAAAASTVAGAAEPNSNLVYLRAVWDEVLGAPRPLVAVCPAPEPGGVPAKVDVVCAGGDEWVKVNTVKESRLMAEFHEQDSYVNSDYDSGSERDGAAPPAAPAELDNTILRQARALVAAARAARPADPPTVRLVLTRLSPGATYADPRVAATFDALRALGVELAFGPRPPVRPPRPRALVPSLDVVLDLSIVIALCCDTSHAPLPRDDAELEARYRQPEPGGGAASSARLREHTSTTSDLRDQLRAEMARPLVPDLIERLGAAQAAARAAGDPRAPRPPVFWVTQEVKDRVPGLVDVIGGAAERARAHALFGAGGAAFWDGSRYAADPGVLRDIRVHVLDPPAGAPERDGARPSPPPVVAPATAFDRTVVAVCDRFLDPAPARAPAAPPAKARGKRHGAGARAAERPPAPAGAGAGAPSSRPPSGHTLRTLREGFARAATVLTNNRGAVAKVLREAGVRTGAVGAIGAVGAGGASGAADGTGDETGDARPDRARIWVVHPSSLAEWRRIEVEDAHRHARAQTGAGASGA